MNGCEVEQLVAEQVEAAEPTGPMMSGESPAAICVLSVLDATCCRRSQAEVDVLLGLVERRDDGLLVGICSGSPVPRPTNQRTTTPPFGPGPVSRRAVPV